MSENHQFPLNDQPNWLRKNPISSSADDNVILANHLILTALTLTSCYEQCKTFSERVWGSPSESPGTKARSRLLSSQMEKLIGNMCGLLRTSMDTWPDLRRILQTECEEYFNIPAWFWHELIYND